MSTLIEPSKQPLNLQLPNGLEVRIAHQAGARMAAARVEVRGGSHDEPGEYPGLAHFLEHCVFLGSRDFPPGEGLIPFVQGLGGRVNASTRARSTEFFCEVPATHLEQALARLLDMLATPLLDSTALHRERAVLEAEYSARACDPQTLCEAALAYALAPGHPLADFHAGNAASLALESPDFIPTLQRFHHDQYQPGRMRLTLVGPQSPEELLELARRLGNPLEPGRSLPEPSVPPMLPLRADRLRLGLPRDPGRLIIAFALEGQGDGLEAAAGFLQRLLNDESFAGLQARLALLGLSDGVRLRLPYAQAGQGLLLMEFEPVHGADRSQLEAELLAWLAFLRASVPWPGLWEEQEEILRRRTATFGPLETAMAPAAPSKVDVRAFLEQLRPERLIRLETCESDAGPNLEVAGFPLNLERLDTRPAARSSTHWRLPPANPYLHPEPPAPTRRSVVPLLPCLSGYPDQGALFLRWLPGQGGLPLGLAQSLQQALRPVLGPASLAGLDGRLQQEQGGLTLSLLGNASLLRQAATDLLPILQAPPRWTLAQGPRLQQAALHRATAELPIRQMLQRLPDLLEQPPTEAPPALDPQALVCFWSQARWQGLGLGDVGLEVEPPGLPMSREVQAGEGDRRWHPLEMPAGDNALLLFHLLQPASPATEAAWRLLASLLEPAFHQRLRGELQLGYALACGFRQLGRQRGLLFAVQSPRVPVAGLLDAIRDFLARQRKRLAHLSAGEWGERVRSLDLQLSRQAASFPDHARQCWLDRLAGMPDGHAQRVRDALTRLQPSHLLMAHDQLCAGQSCLALANAAAPSPDWHLPH
ncbi:pyrroloquinoline quinone biosynthesis protein PqqF [Pseudomonas sp. LFM046]|uniref:pyrroloquinoline quinone biosynthesis protein PqqF n=1 Tax=Pseudomonas sp. LFM046 TaxID=1608357 RepID=UPI0006984EC0|nr:pyrroloquinoline quinone biosynthesis protein PqqF [Pseudomonas sp. LFM046]